MPRFGKESSSNTGLQRISRGVVLAVGKLLHAAGSYESICCKFARVLIDGFMAVQRVRQVRREQVRQDAGVGAKVGCAGAAARFQPSAEQQDCHCH